MNQIFKDDTICAVATPAGEGGIGIIKISGPDALPIAVALFLPSHSRSFSQSHRLYHGWITDSSTDERVDEVLISYMRGPQTYTREDVVEINCHGGYAALQRILELVLAAGARLAEPGEFTRRAFLNGRIDLTQAEAVIDIIHARSQESLLLANRNLEGGLSESIRTWQQALLSLYSGLEAQIDFSDDIDDEPADYRPALLHVLENELLGPMKQALDHFESARLIKEGLTLVLVGKPNVGKSSLMNVLLGKDRAIVTALPGTTRDVIEDAFALSGLIVRILDTAGIRAEPDEIELMGIERTFRSVKEADVVLWLIDQSRPLSKEDHMVFQAIGPRPYVILLNKADLPPAVTVEEVEAQFRPPSTVLHLSVFDPSHIQRVKDYLSRAFLRQPLEMSRSMIVTNLRHKERLELAVASLCRAKELLTQGAYTELVSLELRSARQHLDAVLGGGGDDELLDRIFSKFCIGK
jgi:tRNA modification GTPase